MTPAPPRAAVLLAIGVVLLLAGCAGADPATRRAELLDLVPVRALDRGVVVWEGGLAEGFGSARTAGALTAVLGVAAEDVEAVAETGGSPLTVLRIRTAAADVVERAEAAGYTSAEVGGWTVLRRPAAGGEALDAAVPAAAVRRGHLLVGSVEDVAAVVDGERGVTSERWVEALTWQAGDGALAIAPSQAVLEDAAAAEGGAEEVLDRAGARGDLPPWEGWGLTTEEDGEGALVLVLRAGPDSASADADAAEALALRAATGPVLGGGRRAGDVLEGAGPRFDAERAMLRLPVTWRVDPPALRRDLERGAFAFLLPAR
jgi:hypothetical protein